MMHRPSGPRRAARCLAAAALLALAAHPAAAQRGRAPASRGTPITPELAAATFDSAWSAVNTTLWDTAVANGIWARARSELRPAALRARTVEELRGVLEEAVHRLGYSHFGVIPGDVQRGIAAASGEGEPGMEVRLVGSDVLVTRVDSGGPAAQGGIEPGWTLLSIGGRQLSEVLALLERIPEARTARGRPLYAWQTATALLHGAPGSPLRLRLRDRAGRFASRTLTLAAPQGTVQRFGNLPPLVTRFEARRVPLPGGAGSAGVIRFNYWLPVVIGQLNAAVDSFRNAQGMVIDLRGNLGGLGAMAPGFAGHFLEHSDTLGVMRMRGQTLYFVSNPRTVDTQARPVRVFSGPVAVLTDPMTGSTSEFFAGGLHQLGRVRVFGEPSAAQALPSVAQRLPDGDVLLHALADFTGPRGVRFEGVGVTPDVAAPPSRAALLAGHDTALDAALAWIAAQARSR